MITIITLLFYIDYKSNALYVKIDDANLNLTPTPSVETFPVDQLAVEDYRWENNYFYGSIKNNYKQHASNVEVKIYVSKSRDKWDLGEPLSIVIEDPAWAGESTYFKKYLPIKEKDPWYTTRIVSAIYYYGEKPTGSPVYNNNVNTEDNQEWGKAKQLDEVTWTMKVGQDDRIGTPQEIFEALNMYRQRNSKGSLTWDSNLATFAQQRALYFNSIKNLDKHAGFKEYVNNTDNLKKLGFWGVGENANYGQRLYGVHLIEWIYAGDKPHDDNQLDPSWTHVGIGVDGLGVAIIFGKWKM